MSTLNHRQFAAHTLQGTGGSRSAWGDHEVPTTGYAVAKVPMAGGIGSVPTTTLPRNQVTPAHVQEHLDAIRQQAGDNPELHQGSWLNRKGSYDLDASQVITDRGKAVGAGFSRKEDAVYDIKRDRDIYLRHSTNGIRFTREKVPGKKPRSATSIQLPEHD